MQSRLAARAAMANALRTLTAEVDHWSFYVVRSQMNWDTGEPQPPGLVIHKGEPLDLSDQLDQRLVRSKRVRLALCWPDGGAVEVDLTSRTSRILAPSDSVVPRMKQFDKDLRVGSASRFFTPGAGLLLIFLPLVLNMPVWLGTLYLDQANRDYYLHHNPGAAKPGLTPLEETVASWSMYVYPPALIAALVILWARYVSGGLRIRRDIVSKASFLSFVYKVRTEGLRGESLRQIFIGVAVGLGVALLTFWFAK